MAETKSSHTEQNSGRIFIDDGKYFQESSEKLLLALSITQISKDDYADFHDFSMCLVSV